MASVETGSQKLQMDYYGIVIPRLRNKHRMKLFPLNAATQVMAVKQMSYA